MLCFCDDSGIWSPSWRKNPFNSVSQLSNCSRSATCCTPAPRPATGHPAHSAFLCFSVVRLNPLGAVAVTVLFAILSAQPTSTQVTWAPGTEARIPCCHVCFGGPLASGVVGVGGWGGGAGEGERKEIGLGDYSPFCSWLVF